MRTRQTLTSRKVTAKAVVKPAPRKRSSLTTRLNTLLPKELGLKRGVIVKFKGEDRYGRFVDANLRQGWARVALPGGGSRYNLITGLTTISPLKDQRKGVQLLPKGFNLTPLKRAQR